MKKILLFTLTVFGLLSLCAQPTAVFSPQNIFMNNLSTASFDPVKPQEQPVMTTLTISNITGPFKMRAQLKWNNQDLLPRNGIVFESEDDITGTISVTNRDLITNSNSLFFKSPTPSVSLDQIINSVPILEEAMFAGYFPDGTLIMQVEFSVAPYSVWTAPASFVIRIQNAGNITLLYPGVPIGQNPPLVSTVPVTFLWNNVLTGQNTCSILVKEFPPTLMPNAENVTRQGSVLYQSPSDDKNPPVFQFSEFLPFRDGYYYAWQVSSTLYNEKNWKVVQREQGSGGGSLVSNWFVFRFTSDTTTGTMPQEFEAILSFLNDPAIQNLLGQGYSPTGVVVLNGRTYTGQEALDLINSLIGENMQVNITNN
ncbi:MAG: hypothetical protein PHI68_04555 [Candidatus Cloacimonetes bacterium]|nr:hypothetical protein [Candidatus Cloacimonadota bacterium]